MPHFFCKCIKLRKKYKKVVMWYHFIIILFIIFYVHTDSVFFIHITWHRFICLFNVHIHSYNSYKTSSYTWRKEHWPNSMFFWLRLLMTDNLLKSEAHGRHTYLLLSVYLYYSTFFLSGTYKIFFEILQGMSLCTKTTIVWIVSPLLLFFCMWTNFYLVMYV